MSWPFKAFMCVLLAMLLWGIMLEVIFHGLYEELREKWYHRSEKYRFGRLLQQHALATMVAVIMVVR